MKVTINVTATDIKKGCAGSKRHCPIARAIQRKFKHLVVSVVSFVYFYKSTRCLKPFECANLPGKAKAFIWGFDINPAQGRKHKPFKFELEVPDELFSKETKA